MRVDETGQNRVAARTNRARRCPRTCSPRRSGVHDAAVADCNLNARYYWHPFRHWEKEVALDQEIDRLSHGGPL
jgi:hypothetical protein